MADIDGKIAIEMDYVEIGLVLGALAGVACRITGDKNELVLREINALRANIGEQVQEKLPSYQGVVSAARQ